MGDELWHSIQAENYEAATILSREMADSLELILSGLGWGEEGEAVEVQMPTEHLRRALHSLYLDFHGHHLSKPERDRAYAAISLRFPTMGDLWLCVREGDFEAATPIAREFADVLYLVLDGLGWGYDGKAVDLNLPDAALRRIFGRLHETAARTRASQEAREASAREEEDGAVREARLVLGACRRINTAMDMRAMGASSDRPFNTSI